MKCLSTGRVVFCALLICAFVGIVVGQNETPKAQSPAQSAQPQLQANPSDVATVDSIVAAVYDVISGPAAKKRDWDRMRSLFIPGARLIPTAKRQSGAFQSNVLTVDDFIQRSDPFLVKEGFFEMEVARAAETFGNIAHVFSTYESRHNADDANPFQRGINSIQLMKDGKRWWIVTIFWQGEDEKNRIPEKYLKKN